MVGFFSKQCVEERLTRGLWTAPSWLDCDEYRVYFFQLFGVIRPKKPATVGFVVEIKNSQASRGLCIVTFSPYLEGTRLWSIFLIVEIESVKNKGFAMGIKYPPKRRTSPAVAVNIENVCDVELPRSHKFADVSVGI